MTPTESSKQPLEKKSNTSIIVFAIIFIVAFIAFIVLYYFFLYKIAKAGFKAIAASGPTGIIASCVVVCVIIVAIVVIKIFETKKNTQPVPVIVPVKTQPDAL